MANSRYYSSIALQTTLTGGITPSSTTIVVASTTGFPGALPYTLALDYGTATEELVEVTAVALLSLTVTRAIDGTSASSHNAGAVVRHVSSARDFTDSRTHEASTENVHGVTGVGNDLVGTLSTQTLSNKTLNRATGTLVRVDIFNTGAWTTTVIGDSTNPSPNRLSILDNEVSLNIMAAFLANGALKSIKVTGDTDGSYRFRMTDTDGTTDRWAVLAGGTTTTTPTSTTTFVAQDIVLPDTSTSKRAIRTAAAGGATERFTVWNDGRVDIVGTSTTFSTFDITGPAAHASSYQRILDNTGNTLFTVSNTTKTTLAGTADIKNDYHTGGVSTPVLRIFGRNPGQTGDLTQWVDQAGTIVANVDLNGNATFPGTFNTAITTATTGVLTASAGWTVTDQIGIKKGGFITIYGNITRSGASLAATPSDGNLPDVDVAAVQAGWRPNAAYAAATALMPTDCTDGFGCGSIRLNASTNIFELVSWTPTGVITNGRNYRFTMTYPI